MPDIDNCKIYYLFDNGHRDLLREHIHSELDRVERELSQVRQDILLVQEAEKNLERILRLLNRMKAISVEAAGDIGEKRREQLALELESLKARIDAVVWEECARWSARDAAQIRHMIKAVEAFHI